MQVVREVLLVNEDVRQHLKKLQCKQDAGSARDVSSERLLCYVLWYHYYSIKIYYYK